ncbi:UvrD-helicase domain-containing protein [Denitratimonas sp. CY0512]|uniref:UvrD-helicase domain-containing protein n=1 Tax=Denitratimonas sp. CY0512 TaxID=3131940 RepID=UPI0030A81C87
MSTPANWTTLTLAGAGRSLVEASAGTGKTWTISALYLRLLLEEQRVPQQIIVSTFTNAAAAELSERLRSKLQWALAEAAAHGAGQGIEAAPDEATDRAWLRKRWRTDAAVLKTDVQRLQAALTGFDAAPISTLHSLCSRILADHPFAAGALFNGRDMIDGKTLQAALANDLWRVISQGDDEDELVTLAREADVSRAQLDKYLPVLMQPDVVVEASSPETVIAALQDVVGEVSGWRAALRAVLDQPGLLRAGGKLQKAWIALVDALEAPFDGLAQVLVDHLSGLSEATGMKGVNGPGKTHPEVMRLVEQSTRIAHAIPPHTLDLASSLPLRKFLTAAQHWCQHAMQSRLDAANQSTFDQLLHSVRAALEPREGRRALADALFAAWPVALVDEFQDTDPVQFGILDAIYRDAEGKPRGRLVMIGDPKQSIYRFRGGDVQAYERARDAVPDEDRLTLDTNHRSSRAYVAAVNAFYAATGTRLGPKESNTSISYEPVQASGRRDAKPLQHASNGAPVEQALVLHELTSLEGIVDLTDHALHTCAGQIVWALSENGYRIDGKPLRPGDIAVLLPGHAQIARLGALLKARGVPCVAVSRASVFDTDTARDLRLVLHAVLHAGDPGSLRAALVTRLFGASLREIQQLRDDAAAWDRKVARFHALHALLGTRGPLAVVGSLLEEQAARLLQSVDGERMLTDLRHLGELLQEAWEDCGGGERLMAWFADQMDGGADDADAADTRALRLESDAERVRLMTLHVSKGLEFGVVFLPLMWNHKRFHKAGSMPHLLSDPEDGRKYLMEGPGKERVKQQEFEERFRMLYVVLTRAIHACHVLTLSSDVKRPADAPLNTLDLAALAPDADAEPTTIARHEGWDAHDELRWIPPRPSGEQRSVRPLPPAPRGPLPMRHSFTTLSGAGQSHIGGEDEAAADEAVVERIAPHETHDADSLPDELPATPSSCTFHRELDSLSMIGGADFGNAVHAIFEDRVPGLSLDAQPGHVRAALERYGVRPREGDVEDLAAALTTRLQSVLDTRLSGAGGPCLAALAAHEMRAEMEFNYVLDGASLRALRLACEAHGEAGLVPPREQILAGLMNGKIDLIFAHDGRFHVLDYKSNQLASGARACLEDYAPAALENKMASTGYRFQALLYAVAVERHLRERLGTDYCREQHLGDCWYLFVRAVGLQLPDGTPCGVWRHRFGDALLDAVQNVLGARWQEAA